MNEHALAIVGWAMYFKNYSKEELDKMNGFEVILLQDEYKEWQRKTKKD